MAAPEPGAGMAAFARRRIAAFGNVDVETSTFEEWDDRGRRFDALVAASAWHWVDPALGRRRAHDVLRPGGWMALLGHVVVRRPGEPEVYAETADLHEPLLDAIAERIRTRTGDRASRRSLSVLRLGQRCPTIRQGSDDRDSDRRRRRR